MTRGKTLLQLAVGFGKDASSFIRREICVIFLQIKTLPFPHTFSFE